MRAETLRTLSLHALFLCVVLGMFLMVSAHNLLMVYLSLEFVSIISVVLAGFATRLAAIPLIGTMAVALATALEFGLSLSRSRRRLRQGEGEDLRRARLAEANLPLSFHQRPGADRDRPTEHHQRARLSELARARPAHLRQPALHPAGG